METKIRSTNNTDTRNENLMCWRTATSPQCLRVETMDEIHLFPYGYFQYARFFQNGNREIVQIQFHDWIVTVKGKGLEPLCAALERLAVERVCATPEKYAQILKGNGFVEEIEIKKVSERNKPE